MTEHPHAPWWRPGPEGPRASLHLDAEVVGYGHEQRGLVAPDFLAALREAVPATIDPDPE